jgi:hypothetical protein
MPQWRTRSSSSPSPRLACIACALKVVCFPNLATRTVTMKKSPSPAKEPLWILTSLNQNRLRSRHPNPRVHSSAQSSPTISKTSRLHSPPAPGLPQALHRRQLNGRSRTCCQMAHIPPLRAPTLMLWNLSAKPTRQCKMSPSPCIVTSLLAVCVDVSVSHWLESWINNSRIKAVPLLAFTIMSG